MTEIWYRLKILRRQFSYTLRFIFFLVLFRTIQLFLDEKMFGTPSEWTCNYSSLIFTVMFEGFRRRQPLLATMTVLCESRL